MQLIYKYISIRFASWIIIISSSIIYVPILLIAQSHLVFVYIIDWIGLRTKINMFHFDSRILSHSNIYVNWFVPLICKTDRDLH